MTQPTSPTQVVRPLALMLACLLAACGQAGEPAWVAEARKNCKQHGLALDRDSGGYISTNDVLLCPDGTLRIVPRENAVKGKTRRGEE